MSMRIVAGLIVAGLVVAGLVIVATAYTHGQNQPHTAPANQSKTQNQDANLFQHGLWACGDNWFRAAELDGEFAHFSSEMRLTYAIAEQISKSDGCPRLDSDELKPIKLEQDTFYVTDRGKNEGQVGKWSYFTYMRFHSVNAQSKPKSQDTDPFEQGLWACDKGMWDAYNLDEEFENISSKMQLTYAIAEQISKHKSCRRLNSDELKPVALDQDTLYVTDGKKSEGWVGKDSYFKYMRFHEVRSAP